MIFNKLLIMIRIRYQYNTYRVIPESFQLKTTISLIYFIWELKPALQYLNTILTKSTKKFSVFINFTKLILPLSSTPSGFVTTDAREATGRKVIASCIISTRTTFFDIWWVGQFPVFYITDFITILENHDEWRT